MLRRLALCALAVLLPTLAAAAPVTFGSFSLDDAFPSRVTLSGPINANDGRALEVGLLSFPEITVVLLDSPGGDATAAAQMARIVEAAGLATFVRGDARCFGNCTSVFFAGRERDAAGRLGVNATTALPVDAALDPSVAAAIVDTPADRMHVFTAEEIDTLGIARIGGTLATVSAAWDGWIDPNEAAFRAGVAEFAATISGDGDADFRAAIAGRYGAMPAGLAEGLIARLRGALTVPDFIDFLGGEFRRRGALASLASNPGGAALAFADQLPFLGVQLLPAEDQAFLVAVLEGATGWAAANEPDRCATAFSETDVRRLIDLTYRGLAAADDPTIASWFALYDRAARATIYELPTALDPGSEETRAAVDAFFASATAATLLVEALLPGIATETLACLNAMASFGALDALAPEQRAIAINWILRSRVPFYDDPAAPDQ